MNPYAPPEATVHDLPPRPGSAFKAIALGLAVDVGGSLIATVILAVDRKSTRLNSSHEWISRMPSSA